jgi:hypothetical protein
MATLSIRRFVRSWLVVGHLPACAGQRGPQTVGRLGMAPELVTTVSNTCPCIGSITNAPGKS